MRRSARNSLTGLLGAMVACTVLLPLTVKAQDVGNGLWQNYRYPASNPNWRAEYAREVATWGEFPQEMRPRYNSSADVVWGSASPGGASPFGTQPFYTVTEWNPYVPRPVEWTGLEYNTASDPPESTTGNHAWYGASSPGPRSDTPAEWREWEMNTPEGLRYREASGLAGTPTGARAATGISAPVKEKTSLRQYFRTEPTKPGAGRWQERDARVPPEVNHVPAPDAGAGAGGLKQYVLNRPAGTPKGTTGRLQVVRPRSIPEPKAARFATPPPEHSGFTQYYMRTTPRTGQRHWEVKSKKPATEP